MLGQVHLWMAAGVLVPADLEREYGPLGVLRVPCKDKRPEDETATERRGLQIPNRLLPLDSECEPRICDHYPNVCLRNEKNHGRRPWLCVSGRAASYDFRAFILSFFRL